MPRLGEGPPSGHVTQACEQAGEQVGRSWTSAAAVNGWVVALIKGGVVLLIRSGTHIWWRFGRISNVELIFCRYQE